MKLTRLQRQFNTAKAMPARPVTLPVLQLPAVVLAGKKRKRKLEGQHYRAIAKLRRS